MPECPPVAVFSGVRYTHVRELLSVSGGEAVVLCESPIGEQRYATLDEWRHAGRAHDDALSANGTAMQPSAAIVAIPVMPVAPSAPLPALSANSSPDSASQACTQFDPMPPACVLPGFTHPVATSASHKWEKVAVLQWLFVGRQDVYAHGYLSKKGKPGKIGYTPACMNEWEKGICPKCVNPRSKCAGCAARVFKPLTKDVLFKHCLGRCNDRTDVVALYVMHPDNTTSLLAVDFDGEGWQAEMGFFREACRTQGVPAAFERSRSGEGGHAWIFFSEPIAAAQARKLGDVLLTRAMALGSMARFSAYDRFFPAQDTIEDGGFGSAIALPLQGAAFREGNSVFINEAFEAYPDQWRFLSGIAKMSSKQVKALIRGLETASEDLPLELPAAEGAGGNQQSLLQGEVLITKRNGLIVSRKGLSPATAHRVRRLGVFANPDFYRAQNMRQSVYGKPRFIDLGTNNEEAITLPRGCEARLLALLEQQGVAFKIRDERVSGNSLRIAFTGKLHEDQQRVADELLAFDCGILSAPTGFGKTVIGAYLIAAAKLPTLVIVPNSPLLSQWRDRLEVFLRIDEEPAPLYTKTGRLSRKPRSPIGQLGGGKRSLGGLVDIATYQSLLEDGEVIGTKRVKKLVDSYGMIIVDECQHGAAPQLAQVLQSVPAMKVYGLSATPKRADGLDKALLLLIGPVRVKVDPLEQAKSQDFDRLLLPRFTRIRLPQIEAGATFNQVVDALCAHEARNRLIVDDALVALAQGRNPLVLTRRRSHAAALAAAASDKGFRVLLLTGGGTEKEKRERMRELADLPADEQALVVATTNYIGEGFDNPRFDTLLLAAPTAFEGAVVQYAGRLHRESEGKEHAFIYDYIDAGVPMLDSMYKKRLKALASIGYEVVRVEEDGDPGRIIDYRDFYTVFTKDIEEAERCVRVFAPYVSEQFVSRIAPVLQDARARGIEVFAVVGKAQAGDAAQKAVAGFDALAALDCKVEWACGTVPSMAIIDEAVVWYGTLPLLGFPRKDDCSLRFRNAEIAGDLLNAPVPGTQDEAEVERDTAEFPAFDDASGAQA